ncbi:MAG: ABC transporter [Acidiferrobacteraceae bacterium]|nr:ABC transporter [Acidiferrobacteraceae bacterium]
MKKSLFIGQRVLSELLRDKRLFVLSIIAPLFLIFLLKIFIDSMPQSFPAARYAVPFGAFIVHFLSFLLCAIVLVEERATGTLERMFVAGFSRISIVVGYLLGYLILTTIQAIVVLTETMWLIGLNYSIHTVVLFFLTIWMLAMVSVMLGIFASTFARNTSHILPFIPLVVLPSLFLSGLLVNPEQLPKWAELVGMLLPFRYANDIIRELLTGNSDATAIYMNFVVLIGYGVGLMILASRTLRETD